MGGYPEKHFEAPNIETDIENLKKKVDAGADYIITQLCWDMDQFKWWYDAIRSAGITLPVDVGVMPVLDSASTINMALSHNACVMPRALCEIISRNWIFPNVFSPEESEEEIRRKKDAFMEEGIQYTISPINEYLSLGVDGIHLFTLNKADAVKFYKGIKTKYFVPVHISMFDDIAADDIERATKNLKELTEKVV